MQMLEILEEILREVEQHIGSAGWDQPARLFALVSTGELMESDPQLAAQLNLTLDRPLTSIEQEISATENLQDLLATIAWPDEVLGAMLAIERVVLPKEAEIDLPVIEEEKFIAALDHPLRHDVRIVSAVLKTGENLNSLRYRNYDNADSVAIAADLVTNLNESLLATFQD